MPMGSDPIIHSATVLQLIPKLETGGAEMATVEMTAALVRAGGRSIVFSEGGRMVDEVIAAGGEHVTFPAATKNPVRMLRNALSIARFARYRGIDLIHARSRAPAWSGLLAARRTGTPFVTTYHGAYGTRGPFKNSYNRVMARGDRVIANSCYTADLIRAQHGTTDDRLRIIHRGVDLDRFDPARIDGDRVARLRSDWRVPDGHRIVLQAARLTDWKGQRFVIDAAAALKNGGVLDRTTFIMAGDAQGRDAYSDRLRARIREHGLEDIVKLVGHCADMAAAYRAAHVTVVASIEAEAFGRSSAEAEAMACPVIATDLGATAEHMLVGDTGGGKITGWLVPPANAGALSEALQVALSLGEDERNVMGQRARTHIEENFSVDRMRLATLQVYDELLNTALTHAYRQYSAQAAMPENA